MPDTSQPATSEPATSEPATSEPATSESDVAPDPQLARTRETGGVPDHPDDHTEGDAVSTTGSGESEEFVGRVAGRDLGYAGETGAEARAEAGEENPS